MAGERVEKARIDALLRAKDRELSQAMLRASTRARKQVAQVARATRANGGAARLRAGWVKPPPAHIVRAVGRVIGGGIGRAIRGGRGGAPMAARAPGGARPVGNRGGVSFHFKMGQTGSVGSAVAHQSYIERDGACDASFGNIHETYEERCRLWRALGPRSQPLGTRSERARGLHWSAEAAREWDRIGQGVESYLEVENVGPVDAECVREVLEELRLEAGLTASDRTPDGSRRRCAPRSSRLETMNPNGTRRRNGLSMRSRMHCGKCVRMCDNRRG